MTWLLVRTYAAQVVGYDSTHDVAVLQLQGASGLRVAKIATSSPSVGEAVVAIGNAGGSGGTPTSAGGSILALGQSITANDELHATSEQLSGLIEVNANIQSGDSGGPLVNSAGEVIGMDTAASVGFTFQSPGNQGFAIPISHATLIADQIDAGRGSPDVHVGRTAFIGVGVVPQGQQGLGFPGFGTPYPNIAGADIQSTINGGPAAAAGIGQGDVITSLGGHRVASGSELTHLLVPHHPGDRVEVGWVDPYGQSHQAVIRLANGPPA